MKCEYCNNEVSIWFVHEDKWCCEECKRKFNKNSPLNNVHTTLNTLKS